MIRTRVGYTGGTLKNPSYYRLGDHTETFQVDYDPAKTSYEKLLEVYWTVPNHCATPNSRQYMSAIFYANDAQKKLALESREKAIAKSKPRLPIFVLPLREFYFAEGYHQKYALRQFPPLMQELTQIYPKHNDFLKSTAAARINGFVGGHGTLAQLEKEIDGFGLSPQGRNLLLNVVKRYGK